MNFSRRLLVLSLVPSGVLVAAKVGVEAVRHAEARLGNVFEKEQPLAQAVTEMYGHGLQTGQARVKQQAARERVLALAMSDTPGAIALLNKDETPASWRAAGCGPHAATPRSTPTRAWWWASRQACRAANQELRQSRKSARQAGQLAQSASAVAEKGGQVVGEVMRTMDEIRSSSHKIAEIIGVICGIAFQTSILALNAAVEAARAGEQGRGLAVGASEVRSLARRSAQAAREIRSLIGASVDKVELGSPRLTWRLRARHARASAVPATAPAGAVSD